MIDLGRSGYSSGIGGFVSGGLGVSALGIGISGGNSDPLITSGLLMRVGGLVSVLGFSYSASSFSSTFGLRSSFSSSPSLFSFGSGGEIGFVTCLFVSTG